MDKQEATDGKLFDKAIASGALVAYGDDENLIHQPEGETHDTFWSATSMAGVLNALEELHKSGASAAGVLGSATKHSGNLYVSRFYNWKSGSLKGAYTHGASYQLKQDAPDDAGRCRGDPYRSARNFLDFLHCPECGRLDKVTAALGEALKVHPLAGPAIGSMVDFTRHRDELARTNATYK